MNKPIQCQTRMLLHCMGHVRLQDDAGNDLTPRTRKARALLANLALSGRSGSREQLADLLWSDRAPEQARASFRQAIFELRHLGGGTAAVTSPLRDDVSLNAEIISTDLAAIRAAADGDDAELLQQLLSGSEAGLLTDLDGLDPEFDGWLQVQRGHEPSQTLGIALAAANRTLDAGQIREAKAIAAEVQRLDPCSEEATRLAMRIAAAHGDRGAIHRQYQLLAERLRAEYGAEPSSETRALFEQLSKAGPAVPPEPPTAVAGESASPTPRAPDRRLWLVAVLALALVGIAVIAGQLRKPPTTAQELPLVAVLPFDEVPAANGFLAEGLWDDTRSMLSQGRTVRVLGRTTTEATADDGLSPRDYRQRLGVAYLLDGSVRRQGERVRVNVSLTRTADGVSVWEQVFEGRLGDPMSLQVAIAQGIEGRLRGRLAQGGGRLARQIATTPEVYSLYSEARSLMRKRQRAEIDRALTLLRKAIAIDPNFAPAHASLAIALSIGRPGPDNDERDQDFATQEARHAIALAPNLSEAYAALALAIGLGSDEVEAPLLRAVQLDPGNAEAWTWLGNLRASQLRSREAQAAYEKAASTDPLWIPAASNLAAKLVELNDEAGLARALRRIHLADKDGILFASIQSEVDYLRGDYSTGVRRLINARNAGSGRDSANALDDLAAGLLHMGYYEEVASLFGRPWFPSVLRGKSVPPARPFGTAVRPRDFWLPPYFSSYASRAMINLGRAADVAANYKQGFTSADDFMAATSRYSTTQELIPNLAVALRQVGDGAEADRLLAAAGDRLEQGLKANPSITEIRFDLARVRSAQGDREAALTLLSQAVAAGWYPDGLLHALDPADEPSLAPLKGDPRFERARTAILAHIAKERRELGPVRM